MPEKQKLAEEVVDTRAAEIVARELSLQNKEKEIDQQKAELEQMMDRFRNEVAAAKPGKPKIFDPVGDGHMVPVYYPEEIYDEILGRTRRIMKLEWVDQDHPLREVSKTVDTFTTARWLMPLKPGDKIEAGDKVMAAKQWPTNNIRLNTDHAPTAPTVKKVRINDFGVVEFVEE